MLQTINRTVPATFLSAARQGVFLVPPLLILPPLIDLLGVQLGQPIADVFSFAAAVPLELRALRDLKAGPEAAR